MTIVWNTEPQGSEGWLAARVGVITGSRADAARAKLAKGGQAKTCIDYARDLAREREGGAPPPVFVSAAMRTGTEQEPIARMRYEARTGEMVEEVGFAHTIDGRFGCSVDGLVRPHGAIEVKTMVSSDTLFSALVDGDISAYRGQCLMAIWLLTLAWIDVCLWCPDLNLLRIIRVKRDEAEIEKFEQDMLAFDRMVEGYRAELRSVIVANRDEPWTDEGADTFPPERHEVADQDDAPGVAFTFEPAAA